MEMPVLLKTFTHAAFTPAFSSAIFEGRHSDENENLQDNTASPLTATIDFENGNFTIEGNWHLMMKCNKHAQPEWFDFHKQNVSIEGSIYPGFAIDLADDNNDGAVLILEGNIKDNDTLSTCSGLLVLDKIITDPALTFNEWKASIYLYDNNNEDCEIALKMPVFVNTTGMVSN